MDAPRSMRGRSRRGLVRRKLLVAMVGLPARGKSYIARLLARHLGWLGYATRVFNVGSYRRALLGAGQSHAFFDPGNAEAVAARNEVAREALEDACAWLAGEGTVAIYDATNTTRDRRREVAERANAEGHDVLFLESICDDPAIVDANVRATKLGSPDYADIDEETALRDFLARIDLYAQAYQRIDSTHEDAYPFVQVIDLGRDVRLHRVHGDLPARIVFYLLHTHLAPRVLWLTRHGQSVSNLRDRIGGDAPLTEQGEQYARNLATWAIERAHQLGEPVVWTSTLQRSLRTARHLPFEKISWRALDEIDAGVCDGMSYDEIRRTMPDEWRAREGDKFGYRYPRGESYADVIDRLEPVILELERTRTPVLVVGHQAIVRVLYGYFMDRPPDVCPHLDVPLHAVIELHPNATGADERRHALGPLV